MAIRIPWNKYEVALLIDACVQYETTSCERNHIISDLSKKLRKLAVNNKIEIDATDTKNNLNHIQQTLDNAKVGFDSINDITSIIDKNSSSYITFEHPEFEDLNNLQNYH